MMLLRVWLLAITLPFAHGCADSTTYKFVSTNGAGKTKNRRCQWLTAKPSKEAARINKFCKQTHNGSVVKDECQLTCDNCAIIPTPYPSPSSSTSCEDSTIFKFDADIVNGVQKRRKCQWITARAGKAYKRRNLYCKDSVLFQCPVSCQTCPATPAPSPQPSSFPSKPPSAAPVITSSPTRPPSPAPSPFPTARPSSQPSAHPSDKPSLKPSQVPSLKPSQVPSLEPSQVPSLEPSQVPSLEPSQVPSLEPSQVPILGP